MFRISYDYSDARFLERFYDHTMKGGLAKDIKRGFALGFKDALRHCGVKFANRGFRILPANGDAEFPADEVKAEKAVEKAVKESVKDEIRTRKEYARMKAGQSEVDALCKLAKKAQKERKAEENRLRKIHGPNDVRLKCERTDNYFIVRLQKWSGAKWRTDNDVAFMNVVDGLKWCRERGLVVREVVKPDGKVEVR